MRISSGTLKGRTFYPPADHWPTRPTTDVSRTALFNILQNFIDFESTTMLDLFGGTGAHSYEMVSRGSTDIHYVDSYRQACHFVQKTIQEWGIEAFIKVHTMDYQIFIRQNAKKFDYIFAGPPYPLQDIPLIPDIVFNSGALATNGLLVLEHNPVHDFTQHAHFQQKRNYGQTIFSFFA